MTQLFTPVYTLGLIEQGITRRGQTILKTVQKTIITKKNSIDNKVDIPKWKSLG